MTEGKKNIAVLMGGWSAEREVSLVSGRAAAEALRDAGHEVREIDVCRDAAKLVTALTPKPDVVFNALHGTGGEDGTIQALLDMLGLPYTHSPLRASALAMHKPTAKILLEAAGVPTPPGRDDRRGEPVGPIRLPAVIKPVSEGSSVGVHILRDGANVKLDDPGLWQHGDEMLLEEYIPGRELTVGVMGKPDGSAQAMCVTEIRPRGGFYDYDSKYTDGKADHIVPAQLPQEVTREAMRLAVLAHKALGCRGVSRSDFRYDDRVPPSAADEARRQSDRRRDQLTAMRWTGPERRQTERRVTRSHGLYLMEVNTQPGMTPLSLVPEQAAHLGMSFQELVEWMIAHAVEPFHGAH